MKNGQFDLKKASRVIEKYVKRPKIDSWKL